MDHDQFVRRPGERISLEEFDPGATGEIGGEREAEASRQADAEGIVRHQDMLMAHATHGLLLLFQGMDTAGKDEVIRDVLSGLDPGGCEFKQFKPLTEKEVRHDYLWRAVAALPARGQIAIFNRSYYEHVIVERVHPEKLDRQQLPEYAREGIWQKRFRQINDFEQYLAENGIHVLKFFLHISKEEQRQRLLDRIADAETRWQFSGDDIEERSHWDEYMSAYDEALTHTNTEHAPWHVIPSDHRWFARAAVASVVLAKLKSLHSEYPRMSKEQEDQVRRARKTLEGDETRPEDNA